MIVKMKKIKFRILLSGLLLLSTTATVFSQTNEDAFIANLINKMTLREKIGQMHQLAASSGYITGFEGVDKAHEAVRRGEIGSLLNDNLGVENVNKLQRIAVEESRLGIPLIFARDVIHGYKTIFPIPLGQAATWNPQLVEEGSRFASLEATSHGIRWTFAPMIDVTRDPRWGRIAESLGEDPYLTSVLGVAMVKGFQGEDPSKPTSMAACAKHFAGYGASEAGKDYNTTWIPEHQLREVFLPPFKDASDAGVLSFMCSFNDINGIPSSGNKYLNVDILRKEWGFNGVLVSDWESIAQMETHGVCNGLKETAAKASNAGVDIDMVSFAYIKHLEELVKEGVVSEKQIDEAVRNILRMKFKLGLFENPYTNEKKQNFYSKEALESAKQTAIESVVLLKNEKNILPLKKSVKTLAVIGPLADAPADQLGTWCFDADPNRSVTPIQAIRNEYSKDVKIIFEKALTHSRDKTKEGIARAIKATQQADVAVVFVGEEAILSGEGKCRADINLPGAQIELIKELKKIGKPIILVVMAGRPLTIEKEIKAVDAVLYAFHGGTMAGPALADLIFGKVTPSGKLPVTMPKHVGQVPVYYSHKNTGRPPKGFSLIDDIPVGGGQNSIGFTCYHLDAGSTPLFPFGYGMSYTNFKYSEPTLSSSILRGKEILVASCEVTNIGSVAGNEIVQLYVRDLVGSLARPVKELKGFDKIHLKAGETKTIKFQITADQLSFWNENMEQVTEPGEFNLWIAPDSQSGNSISFKYQK